jgi:hypothetical protein
MIPVARNGPGDHPCGCNPKDCSRSSDGHLRVGDNSPRTVRMLFPGRASTVREVGALSDLDEKSVRIADVAARLAVLGDRLRDELRSSTFP